MKKTIIYSLIMGFAVIAACRKEDNPGFPEFEKVPVPTVAVIAAESDTRFDLVRPDTFHAKFTVGLFFEEDVKPKKLDVVIMRNESAGEVKVFKANVTTFPSTFEITGAELIALFGKPINAGDKFAISVNITTATDLVYLGFPPAGTKPARGWGTNIDAAFGGNTTVINFNAPCVFHIEDYVGDFVVVTDEWADYVAGDAVTVTTIGRDTLAFKYLTKPAIPIYIKVDTVSNKTSVAMQGYGDYPQFGITGLTAVSVPSAVNEVDPCTVTVGVRLHHSDDQLSNYGDNTIILRKK